MDAAGPAARCPFYQTPLSHCSILLVFASMAQQNVLYQFNLQLCTSVHLHLIQTLCLTNDKLHSFSEMNGFSFFSLALHACMHCMHGREVMLLSHRAVLMKQSLLCLQHCRGKHSETCLGSQGRPHKHQER